MAFPIVAKKILENRSKERTSSPATTALIAGGLGIGVFLGIRVLVKRFKRNFRESQVLTEGNPASYAVRLKMAFENDNAFGWGTDEELVFQTLELIPNASTMRRVQRAYRDLHGSNLSVDLKSELTIEEYAIALEIINSKK